MAGIYDLLNWMDNQRRTVGRNLSDLVRNPQDYLKGVANELPNTVREYAADPMNFVGGKMGGVGMTAWHGSPHKFDKFDLSKIGTGEGAQAYGHGLYLAEAPEVAKDYAVKLSNVDSSGYSNAQLNAQNLLQRFNGDKDWAKEVINDQLANITRTDPNYSRLTATLDVLEGKAPQKLTSTGHIYKTDIPDEAVARFLDWDKPLSQQSPEVRKYFEPMVAPTRMEMAKQGDPRWGDLAGPSNYDPTGSELLGLLRNRDVGLSAQSLLNNGIGADVSSTLQKSGIPGIRYLDGGSRSSGQGSSNFVVFDPEMIRILERNGQATGNVPWKPGEYRPLNDLMNVRKD